MLRVRGEVPKGRSAFLLRHPLFIVDLVGDEVIVLQDLHKVIFLLLQMALSLRQLLSKGLDQAAPPLAGFLIGERLVSKLGQGVLEMGRLPFLQVHEVLENADLLILAVKRCFQLVLFSDALGVDKAAAVLRNLWVFWFAIGAGHPML